jgi:Domain of unknown function (DUF4304)
MIVNEKELYKFVDSLLSPEGFIRKKETYYLNYPEFIVFFVLLKSEWGGQYGSAMGCMYKELLKEKTEFPRFTKGHIRYSPSHFVDEDLLKRVFDLENNEFKGEERELLIKEIIELYVLPFLKEISTVEGLKMAMDKYEDLHHYARVSIKDALDLHR